MSISEIRDVGNKIIEAERAIYEKPPDDQRNSFTRSMITGGQQIDRAALLLSKQSYLIKDIVSENAGLILIYGPPGGGKSLMAVDMALCISTGTPWHGLPVKKKGVLYLAAEGQAGMLVRIKASQKHKNLDSSALSDFSLLPLPCLIDEPNELESLLAAIRELPTVPGVIFIDTVARSMIGDENSTKDMGAWVRACDRIREVFKAQVIPIHHSGKNETKGARGAIALTGATDCIFKVYKTDNIISLVNERQKDAEVIPPMLFETEVVLSGVYDSDGFERTSLVLIHNPDLKLTGKKGKPDGGLTGQAKIVMDILRDVLKQKGESPSPAVADDIAKNGIVTPATRVIHEDVWRDEAYMRGITDSGSKEDAKRKAFWNARKKLLSDGLIGCISAYYWIKE